MEDNDRIQRVTIRALAHLAETRDPETGNHILRTQSYMGLLARRLALHPRHAAVLDEALIEQLVRSAPLHDIGKVGIPDHILLKRTPLEPEEWEVMKTHARLGADAIEQAESDIDHPVAFLQIARQIARWHHERWDGQGYPDGLAGEAIPLAARLMAVADVFDSLVSARVYKQPFSVERARQSIIDGRGTQFDPDVVDAFSASFDDFVAVARSHGLPSG
jgi:putative two-component system response regulator